MAFPDVPDNAKIKLPPEVCDVCTQNLQSCNVLDEFLRKAHDCMEKVGLSAQAMIDENNQHREFFAAVKRNFFPNAS